VHTWHKALAIGEDRATLKLVEIFAAAILVVMMLAIVAIVMGFLPSRTG
jgi:hypothetical protein